MATSARELTKLIEETNQARQNLDKLLDFVDLVNKNLDELPLGAEEEGEGIKKHSDEIGGHIKKIRQHLQARLDEIPIDPEEVKDGAERLLLYHGTVDHVVVWAGTQMQNHEENSYWWRYWKGVYDAIMEKHVEE